MDVRDKIKESGLKATPQRKLVYNIISELGHASIDEVISRVHQRSPDITVSTIYRILESFYNVGLLLKMTFPNGKTFFDITPTEHYHIFDMNNNQVVDFEDEYISEVIRERVKDKIEDGEQILGVSIQIITSKK